MDVTNTMISARLLARAQRTIDGMILQFVFLLILTSARKPTEEGSY